MNNFYFLTFFFLTSFSKCSLLNKLWPELKTNQNSITATAFDNKKFEVLNILFKSRSKLSSLPFFLSSPFLNSSSPSQRFAFNVESSSNFNVSKATETLIYHNLSKREISKRRRSLIKTKLLTQSFLNKKNKRLKSSLPLKDWDPPNISSFDINFNTSKNGALILNLNLSSESYETNKYEILENKQRESKLINNNCFHKVNLNSETIVITSPGWDKNLTYSPNLNCTWLIKVNSYLKKSKIKIKINYLEIEEDKSRCSYDYLEIKGLQKFCGVIFNKEIFIHNSSLVLIFKSDYNYQYKGFNLELSFENEECVSEIIASSFDVITSPGFPNNYPDSFECWTLLNAEHFMQKSKNITITFTFVFIDLEQDAHCTYDFVEILKIEQKNIKSGKSLGKFCGSFIYENINSKASNISSIYKHFETTNLKLTNTNNKFQVKSSGPYLLIHFKSDDFLNAKGFKAHYQVDFNLNQCYSSICKEMLNKSHFILKSPNHPKNYPSNVNCSLVIEAPTKDEQIVLAFDSFTLELDSNCSFDRLEIFEQDSIKPSQILCGRKSIKFKYQSKFSKIRIKFYSDSFAEYSGFFARYIFVKNLQSNLTKPTFFEFEAVPKNESVLLGSSFLLTCKAKLNSSHNDILWYKDGYLITNGISMNGTKFLLTEFTESNVGRYTCKNGPHVFEAWLTLKISSYCKITFEKRLHNLVVSEFENVFLECNAKSVSFLNNTINITWLKDGQKLINNEHFEQLENGFLIIKNVQKEDSGFYYCLARIENKPDCVSQSIAQIDVKNKKNIEAVCGVPSFSKSDLISSKANLYGKIIGGMNAQKGAFPWQVMLWTISRKCFCGGALLNERWIVTAAHCLTRSLFNPVPPPLKSIIVRLGKYDQRENEAHEVNLKIKDVVEHPNFNPNTYDNDIALIRLTNAIKFNEFIQPVCLGTSKRAIDEIFFDENDDETKMGYVTGWGQLKEKGPQPRYLQEIKIPIIRKKICKESTSLRVTSNMFCAGYNQEVIGDSCKGDSGGPFVGQNNEKWFLLGIVSWGEGCGDSGKYGFYTKVNNYIDWIQELIRH